MRTKAKSHDKEQQCIADKLSPDSIVEMYQALVAAVAEQVFVVDLDLNVVYAVPKTLKQSKLPKDEIIGRPINVLLESLGYPVDMSYIRSKINEKSLRDKFCVKTMADDKSNWYEYIATPITDVCGTPLVQVVITNITDKQDARYYRNHDVLTGLKNRHEFFNTLQRLNKPENLPISMVMLKIDNLMLLNESLGYDTGDKILKRMAHLICETYTSTQFRYRLESDLFCVVVPNTGAADTKHTIGRLTDMINDQDTLPGVISLSYGYAVKETITENIAAVYVKAERQALKQTMRHKYSKTRQMAHAMYKGISTHKQDLAQYAQDLADMAGELARMTHQKDEDIENIMNAAYMHNIGLVYERTKGQALTSDELLHASCKITKSISHLTQAANIMMAHHETWDGTGFPFGLKGKYIPIGARIFVICQDYIDSIRQSDRVTRYVTNKAIKAISDGSGTKYDPGIANVFIAAINSKKIQYPPALSSKDT